MAEKKKEKHRCPAIADGWGLKITGPAWNGESAQEARKAWQGFVRLINNEEIVRPMPRRTYSEHKH
jgi:hypothetical protein